jgi:hydroxyethylthiazole kinase-like uncharacterized protein yjeF
MPQAQRIRTGFQARATNGTIDAMHRIAPNHAHPLFDIAATRRIEQAAAAQLPPHTLMQRAGLAVARLALALAPHARMVWIACGPGNNGGDGLEAAMHLKRWGGNPSVTWLGDERHAPPDALESLIRARQAGVHFADHPPPGLTEQDLCIDALLGIGVTRPPQGRMADWMDAMRCSVAPVLSVDVPSGLNADTGQFAVDSTASVDRPQRAEIPLQTRHTLTLLTVKPGLFTAAGRDAAGTVWFDNLGVDTRPTPPASWLSGPPGMTRRAHASHKGSFGDVAVIGGEGLAARGLGMTGAALLAASAALHGGAGRVLVSLLDGGVTHLDTHQPELMFRTCEALDLRTLTVVCGCGGGDAVRRVLPAVLSLSPRLVLDADALNAIATDTALQTLLHQRALRGLSTVLTPHPLEAARLLGRTAQQVQVDRLGATRDLASRFGCVVVLKGSGTVIAAPGEAPLITPTGNARLATAGTGDVLAGFVGALLASGQTAPQAACSATFQHGAIADAWPPEMPLTASALARRLQP